MLPAVLLFGVQGVKEGEPGPTAFSRFYDNQGVFSWQPCWVINYDK